MEDLRDFFRKIEGIDESGEARALSCLMIEKREGDAGAAPVIRNLVHMQDACVSVSLTSDFAVVDLAFENHIDYEYLQAGELCRGYMAMTDVGMLAESEGELLSLVLSVAPKGEYDLFLMGMDAAWCFMPKEPDGLCSVIRLIFLREKFGVYEFTEEAVAEMIEEAGKELEEQERQSV